MQKLPQNDIIQKKTSTVENVKETHYSNCYCGIQTAIKNVLRHL